MRQLKITQSITNRDSKTLEKYFNEISHEELLTPEQEVELAQRIRAGDKVALNKLVKSNLRFVVSVAKQYQHTNIPLNDLINEGNLGLVKAATRFDETKGFKFISYAVWWIRQSIIQALAEQSRFIRLPSNKIASLSKINKASSSLEQQFEREPTDSELAELLGMSVGDVKNVVRSSSKKLSVDSPLTEDDGSSLLDILENKDANDVEKKLVIEDSLKAEIERLFSILTEKEQEVIKLFFGIDYDTSKSLGEIGEILGLTRERVRQIKDRSLNKLASHPSISLLLTYLG